MGYEVALLHARQPPVIVDYKSQGRFAPLSRRAGFNKLFGGRYVALSARQHNEGTFESQCCVTWQDYIAASFKSDTGLDRRRLHQLMTAGTVHPYSRAVEQSNTGKHVTSGGSK
jgi:hypothetical protein